MTDEQYSRWSFALRAAEGCIKKYEKEIGKLTELQSAMLDNGPSPDMDIGIDCGGNHVFYYTDDKEVYSCVKQSIESKLELYRVLLADSVEQKENLLKMLSVNEELLK